MKKQNTISNRMPTYFWLMGLFFVLSILLSGPAFSQTTPCEELTDCQGLLDPIVIANTTVCLVENDPLDLSNPNAEVLAAIAIPKFASFRDNTVNAQRGIDTGNTLQARISLGEAKGALHSGKGTSGVGTPHDIFINLEIKECVDASIGALTAMGNSLDSR